MTQVVQVRRRRDSRVKPKVVSPALPRLNSKSLKTLKQWQAAFLAYFDTGRATNGGTEAINGLTDSLQALHPARLPRRGRPGRHASRIA